MVVLHLLTTISVNAFSGCSGITGSLIFPSSLTTLQGSAFVNCSNITGTLDLTNLSNLNYSYVFSGCSNIQSVILPPYNTITAGYFNNCTQLTDVTNLNTATDIGDAAFYNCGLSSTITLSANSIGVQAFMGCNFTTVTFTGCISPDMVGPEAFYQGTGTVLADQPSAIVNSQSTYDYLITLTVTTGGINMFNGVTLNIPSTQTIDDYSPLNTFVILAESGITGSYNLTSDAPAIYYGTYSGSTGTIDSTTVSLNTDLPTLSNAIDQVSLLRNYININPIQYMTSPSSGVNTVFEPGICYYCTSGLSFNNSNISFNDANPNSQFFIYAINGITFTNVSFTYTISPTNIFWGGQGLTISSATSSVPGIFLISNSININSIPIINGRLYSDSSTIDYIGTGTLYVNGSESPCYAKGTLILTDQGLVPIENIKENDSVVTYGKIHNMNYVTSDKYKVEPVVWISSFKVRCLNADSRPICIKKHALRKNYPFQDLYVSPNHSLLVNHKMVTAISLVNGTTIYQDTECTELEYYHLECKEHYAIFANGVLAESYFDANNRYVFENKTKPISEPIYV